MVDCVLRHICDRGSDIVALCRCREVCCEWAGALQEADTLWSAAARACAPLMPLPPILRAEDFRIVAQLSHDVHELHLATHIESDTVWALKLCDKTFLGGDEDPTLKQWHSEQELLKSHRPGVVQLHGSWESPEQLCMVLQHLPAGARCLAVLAATVRHCAVPLTLVLLNRKSVRVNEDPSGGALRRQRGLLHGHRGASAPTLAQEQHFASVDQDRGDPGGCPWVCQAR